MATENPSPQPQESVAALPEDWRGLLLKDLETLTMNLNKIDNWLKSFAKPELFAVNLDGSPLRLRDISLNDSHSIAGKVIEEARQVPKGKLDTATQIILETSQKKSKPLLAYPTGAKKIIILINKLYRAVVTEKFEVFYDKDEKIEHPEQKCKETLAQIWALEKELTRAVNDACDFPTDPSYQKEWGPQRSPKDGKDDYDLYPPSLTFPEETSTVKLDIWPKSEPSAGQSPSSAKADDRNDNSPQKTTRRIHVHGYARPSYHFLCDIGWIKGERSLSKTHAHAFSAAAVVDEIMSWCREGQLTLSKTKHAIWLLDKGWQHIDTQFSDFYQRKDRSDDKQNSQQLEEERQTEIATLQQQMRELQQLTFQQETNPATIEPILQRAFETIKSSLAALKQGVELVQHIQEEISQTDEPSPMVSVVPPLPHSKGSSTEDAAVYASPAPEKRAKSCVREIREGGKTPTDLYNHLSHEIQNAILELQRLRNLDSTQQTDFSAKHQLIVGLLNKSRRLLQKHDHLLQSSAPEETKVPDTAPPDMRVLQFLPLDIDQYASFSCRPTYQTAPYICSLINSLDQLNERAILLLATPDHPIRDFLPAYKTLCEQLKNENPKFTFHTPATSRKETPHHGRASSAETPDAPTFRGASAGCS